MKAGTQAQSPPALVPFYPQRVTLVHRLSMMSLTLDAIPFLLGSEIQGWVPEMDFFDS